MRSNCAVCYAVPRRLIARMFRCVGGNSAIPRRLITRMCSYVGGKRARLAASARQCMTPKNSLASLPAIKRLLPACLRTCRSGIFSKKGS